MRKTFLVVCCLAVASARAQTPFDASSKDPVPNLAVHVNPDQSLEVVWKSAERQLWLSQFSGQGWANAQHTQVTGALDLLGGFAKDEQGNRYVVTMKEEQTRDSRYRPNTVNLMVQRANSSPWQLLADLNQKQFSSWHAIFNPLIYGANSRAYHTSRLVYGNGALAVGFAHNAKQYNEQDDPNAKVHLVGALMGVGTDGSALYGETTSSGGQIPHSADIRLHFDGTDFMYAQAYEDGIALSKLSQTGGQMSWTGHRIVFMNPDRTQLVRIGGIATTPDAYLVLLAQGSDFLWNAAFDATGQPPEDGDSGGTSLFLTVVPKNFDTLRSVRESHTYPTVKIASPADPNGGCSRPKFVDLGDGRYLVCFEQWIAFGSRYSTTVAMLINASGQIQATKDLGQVRLQKSADAFYLPGLRRAAFVSGDAQNRCLILHTLDADLALSSFQLGGGPIASTQLPATPLNVPPQVQPPAPQPPPASFNVAGDWEIEGQTFPFRLSATPKGISMTSSERVTTWTPLPNQPNTYRHDNAENFQLVFTSASAGTLQAAGATHTIRRRAAP